MPTELLDIGDPPPSPHRRRLVAVATAGVLVGAGALVWALDDSSERPAASPGPAPSAPAGQERLPEGRLPGDRPGLSDGPPPWVTARFVVVNRTRRRVLVSTRSAFGFSVAAGQRVTFSRGTVCRHRRLRASWADGTDLGGIADFCFEQRWVISPPPARP